MPVLTKRLPEQRLHRDQPGRAAKSPLRQWVEELHPS